MSRSSPAPPLYLFNAIDAVTRVLMDAYPEPMTARQIADVLKAEGFRWPLRDGYVRRTGADGERYLEYRDNAYADPTPEAVRRVCNIRGNSTKICHYRNDERPQRWTIWEVYMRDRTDPSRSPVR